MLAIIGFVVCLLSSLFNFIVLGNIANGIAFLGLGALCGFCGALLWVMEDVNTIYRDVDDYLKRDRHE